MASLWQNLAGDARVPTAPRGWAARVPMCLASGGAGGLQSLLLLSPGR